MNPLMKNMLGVIAASIRVVAIDSRVLQLSFNNGTVGAQDATDESPAAAVLTWANGAQVVDQPSKEGDKALHVNADNGTDDSVRTPPLTFAGGDDFTIETWFYSNHWHGSQWRCMLGNYLSSNAGSWGVWARDDPSNILHFGIQGGSNLVGVTDLDKNRWYHMAVSRKDGICRMFLDGVMENSADWTGEAFGGTEQLEIGGNNMVNEAWRGHLDLVRINIGESLYDTAASFTPPAYFDPPDPEIFVTEQSVSVIEQNVHDQLSVWEQQVYVIPGALADQQTVWEQTVYVIEIP